MVSCWRKTSAPTDRLPTRRTILMEQAGNGIRAHSPNGDASRLTQHRTGGRSQRPQTEHDEGARDHSVPLVAPEVFDALQTPRPAPQRWVLRRIETSGHPTSFVQRRLGHTGEESAVLKAQLQPGVSGTAARSTLASNPAQGQANHRRRPTRRAQTSKSEAHTQQRGAKGGQVEATAALATCSQGCEPWAGPGESGRRASSEA